MPPSDRHRTPVAGNYRSGVCPETDRVKGSCGGADDVLTFVLDPEPAYARVPAERTVEVSRMLELTENAIEAVKELSADSPAGGVRIYSEAGAGDEVVLAALLVELPAEDDELVEEEGARVYLDPGAAAVLEDKRLDTYVEDGRVHLAVLEQT